MGYEVSYKGMDPEAADEKAISDIMEYLGIEKAALFGDLVALATHIEWEIPCESNDGQMRTQKIQGLNMAMGFAGISGFPFHAFCRRFCPTKYKKWMDSSVD